MVELWTFVAVSIPAMILLGVRHAFDADHITAIDNLVRLHNANKRSRWVGTGFSTGHMVSVLAEMVFIILIVGSITAEQEVAFWGGIVGVISLGVIGTVNIYAMRRWDKTGSAILAGKVLKKTHLLGPFGSSFATGMVFGLGFDTATQISAITISAVASATLGIQTAVILAGFFAAGMVPLDTLNSILLRRVFSKIIGSAGFRPISYALSGVALSVAAITAYETLANVEVLPDWAGPSMAGGIIAASFAYSFLSQS